MFVYLTRKVIIIFIIVKYSLINQVFTTEVLFYFNQVSYDL